MALPKSIRRIAVVSVASLLVLLVVAWFARNAIATGVFRTVATRLLGVNVSVEAVRLDPFGLKVEVQGLVVDNPPGWGAPHALQAGLITVQASSETTAKSVVVDLVGLQDVTVWFILDGTRSNVSAIVDNLSAKDAEGKEKPTPAAGDGVDLLVRRLSLENVTVRFAEKSKASAEVPVLATLPKVEVKDIHGKTAGKDLSEQLVGQVFEATMIAVIQNSGGKLPAAIGSGVMESVKAGGRLGAAAVEAFGQAAKGATDAVGGLIKGIGDAVGGKK